MSDTPVTILPIELIVSNPKIRQGRPIIAGTGICVQDIVAAHIYKNRTPTEVAQDYAISLAQAHAALAYYYAHQDEIDTQLQSDLEFGRKAKEQGLGQRHKPLL